VFIARILGATEYGKFSFALSFVSLFAFLSELGLQQIVVREFSREKKNEKDLFALLSLKLLINFIFFFAVFFFSFFVTSEEKIRLLIWSLSLLIIIEGFLSIFYAFFHARQKMEYESTSRILESLLIFLFAIFSLLLFPNIFYLSFSYLLAAFFTFLFVSLFFHLKFFPLYFKFDSSVWKKYLKLSWPLALLGFLISLFNNFDSVFLGYLNMMKEVGWYNAVKRIVSASALPCFLLNVSFFPMINSLFFNSREKFKKLWFLSLKLIFFLAFPILLGAIFLAQKIIDFVYDPSFFPAIFSFRSLSLMIFFNVLSLPFSRALLILNEQKKISYAFLVSTLINLFLNLILIPRYSLNGASLSSLVAMIFFFLLSVYFLKRVFPFRFKENNLLLLILGTILSSLLMIFFISRPFFLKFHLIFIIFLGSLFYFLSFSLYYFLLKFFKIELF
ncbi:MAG: flippase, partial [Minisyncoccales bacterium]